MPAAKADGPWGTRQINPLPSSKICGGAALAGYRVEKSNIGQWGLRGNAVHHERRELTGRDYRRPIAHY